jgi:selenocysteine lyase/cysteine desulfurase
MLACQRSAFAIPDDVAYFNCAYMAPMMNVVERAAQNALARIAAPWQVSAEDFFAPAERARELFAQLIGARRDDVAIVSSASFGLSTAARNLPLRQGQAVLLLEGEFPSNVYPWHALARRVGAEIRVVRRPADADWTSAVLAAADDRVAIAALSHCHWTDGGLLDLERISAALQRRGTRLVLDVTQSLGALPFDVNRVKVDYLACAGYKWLLGPYGLGFLYAAPEHHGAEPLDYNWITREHADDFAGLVDYRDTYQPGARRFDVGERSSFVLLPMVIAALEQLLAWTPQAIAETLAAITERIAAHSEALGLGVAPRSTRAGHLLGLRVPDAARLLAALRSEQIYVSSRGTTVRVAPHLFIGERDIERLLAALSTHAS